MQRTLHGLSSSTDCSLMNRGDLRQSSVISAFQCVESIVDTLSKIDPTSEVSRGTLYCLHSNILHVMTSIRYSSWWSAEFKKIMLLYLEQGQSHLQGIMECDARSEKYSYFLEQCIRALINAVEWWRFFTSVYSIAFMLEAQIQALSYADYMN